MLGPNVRVTREETGKLLGLSVAEIRRKEKMGTFRVVGRGPHGRVYYSRKAVVEYGKLNGRNVEDIDAYAPFTAEESAIILPELHKGKSLIECAIACPTVHPSKIASIAAEYGRLSGSIVLDKDTVEAINELPLDGTFPITKASDVLSLLQEAGSDTCALCEKHPKHMCKACAIPFVRRQLQKEAREKKAATEAEAPAAAADD